MPANRQNIFLLIGLLACGACKKSEPPKKPVPEKSATSAPAPKPSPPAKPEAEPAAKRIKKKPKPIKASRKAPKKVDTYVKEIIDVTSPEVVASGKPSVVYFYGNFTGQSKHIMGVFDGLSVKYKGRVNFFRIDGYSAMRARKLPAMVKGVPALFFIQGQRFAAMKGWTRDKDPKKLLTFHIEEWLDEDLDEEEDGEDDRRKISDLAIRDPAQFLRTIAGPDDALAAQAGKPAFIVFYDTWVGETATAFLGGLIEVANMDESSVTLFKVDAAKAREEGRLPGEIHAIPSILLIKDGKRRVHPAFKQKSTDKKVHFKELKSFIEGKS